MKSEQLSTIRRPRVIDAVAGAAAAWGTFVMLGFGAATIAGSVMFEGSRELWWPAWPIMAGMIAALPALVAVSVLAPLMLLLARRLNQPASWLPFGCAAVIGAVLAILGVVILMNDAIGLAVLRPGVLASAVWSYGATGAVAAAAGWSVLALRKSTGTPSADLPDPRSTLPVDEDRRLPRAW